MQIIYSHFVNPEGHLETRQYDIDTADGRYQFMKAVKWRNRNKIDSVLSCVPTHHGLDFLRNQRVITQA